VVCAPGDLVVADADGVVIVPRDDAATVLAEAQAIQRREAKRIEEIRGGSPRRAGIDEELIRRGVLGAAS
jgi:regulator of RNase E activity RraA